MLCCVGKSTLLDVLAGKKTSGLIEGEILVNGRPKDATFTRIAGYVEQTSSINPMSTVREAIQFSGRMRLPQHFSDREVELKVKNVLEVLGLSHLADENVGSPGMGGVTAEVRKKVTTPPPAPAPVRALHSRCCSLALSMTLQICHFSPCVGSPHSRCAVCLCR